MVVDVIIQVCLDWGSIPHNSTINPISRVYDRDEKF